MVGARAIFRMVTSFTVTTLSKGAEQVDRLVLFGRGSKLRSLEADRFRFTGETAFVVEIVRSPARSFATAGTALALFTVDLVAFRCFFENCAFPSSMTDNSFPAERIDRRVAGALAF